MSLIAAFFIRLGSLCVPRSLPSSEIQSFDNVQNEPFSIAVSYCLNAKMYGRRRTLIICLAFSKSVCLHLIQSVPTLFKNFVSFGYDLYLLNIILNRMYKIKFLTTLKYMYYVGTSIYINRLCIYRTSIFYNNLKLFSRVKIINLYVERFKQIIILFRS